MTDPELQALTAISLDNLYRMIATNDQRKVLDQSMAYVDDCWYNHEADMLREELKLRGYNIS